MKIYYLTSSLIPSINANTVNVISMCSALSKYSKKIDFFFSSKDGIDKFYIKKYFNISFKNQVNLNFSKTIRFHEFSIFLKSLRIFFKDLFLKQKPDLVICRNIYGAFFFSFFFQKIFFETHTIEKIYFRKIIQSFILKKNNVITIAITKSLKNKLINTFELIDHNINVLPDASFDNSRRNIYKKKKLDGQFKIGYFGHLYKGRGIEIIINIAKKLTNFQFYIVGGDKNSYLFFKKKNLPKNIILTGHKNFKISKELMQEMDILLCPYQKQVYLKDQKTSTSSIMSPLKLFEYMSTNKIIISSNLNVLKEILINNVNCFLVNPKNTQEWVDTIIRIQKDKSLSKTISNKAYLSFKSKYSWDIRVKKLFKFLDEKKF